MALAPLADITGVGFLADQIDQRPAAQILGHLPGRRLVEIHQRRLDPDVGIEPEAQGLLLRLQRRGAAVGITGIVRLAHTADQHADAAANGQSAGQREEEQVPARHKGVRQARPGHGDLDLMGHRRRTERLQHARIDHVIRPETGRPGRECSPQRGQQPRPAGKLDTVALTIVEADRLHPVEPAEGPGKAGGRILSAREQDEGRRSGCRHRRRSTSPAVCGQGYATEGVTFLTPMPSLSPDRGRGQLTRATPWPCVVLEAVPRRGWFARDH